MPLEFGQCFNVLYAVAVAAARQILGGSAATAPPQPPWQLGGRPFEGSCGPWPYSSSFFNIFNYDHGCLNAHRDRGLLTVVYGVVGADLPTSLQEELPDAHDAPGGNVSGAAGPSRLWLRVPRPLGARWVAAEPGQLLLWAGDGLRLAGVEPVEHSVRAAPEGPYIVDSHHRRDPAAARHGNRRSVALVLDE